MASENKPRPKTGSMYPNQKPQGRGAAPAPKPRPTSPPIGTRPKSTSRARPTAAAPAATGFNKMRNTLAAAYRSGRVNVPSGNLLEYAKGTGKCKNCGKSKSSCKC